MTFGISGINENICDILSYQLFMSRGHLFLNIKPYLLKFQFSFEDAFLNFFVVRDEMKFEMKHRPEWFFRTRSQLKVLLLASGKGFYWSIMVRKSFKRTNSTKDFKLKKWKKSQHKNRLSSLIMYFQSVSLTSVIFLLNCVMLFSAYTNYQMFST